MRRLPPCFGIIPARYASTRFPGKPLADILGKPMFAWVAERAARCPELSRVVLATDDLRILAAAEERGVEAVLTSGEHPSGTDRVFEAAVRLGVPEEAVVVNVQGDEPALDPAMLSELVGAFADREVQVATLARRIGPEEAESPDAVKAVLSRRGDALYFSRAPIPFPRDGGPADYLLHVGVYAFRMDALRRFTALAPSPLEQREKLEQLRLLEHGIPIRVVETARVSRGVDRPEDVEAVARLLENEQ